MTGAVLHFVQQTFDQVPIVGDAHGYGLLLWTEGVHRLGPAGSSGVPKDEGWMDATV
jgi:hypothetical protein